MAHLTVAQQVVSYLSRDVRKPVFGVWTRSDTNRAVLPQKMASGLKFWSDCTMYKIKALISCIVNVQLICAFVFAYAKSWFSQEPAHLTLIQNPE